jgi:hypothetical protein
VSADTSGALLHLRGYRQALAKAPLRETLAAGLLMGSGWTGQTHLTDPMCGSGTIPIEGALMARRMAPGIKRRFAFLEWPGVSPWMWPRLVAEAEAFQLARCPVRISASDRDQGAIPPRARMPSGQVCSRTSSSREAGVGAVAVGWRARRRGAWVHRDQPAVRRSHWRCWQAAEPVCGPGHSVVARVPAGRLRFCPLSRSWMRR